MPTMPTRRSPRSPRIRVTSYLSVAALFALMIPLLIACGPQASPTAAPAAATTPTVAVTTAATTAATAPAAAATAAPTTAATSAASPARAASPAVAGDDFPRGGKNSTLEPVGRKGGRVIEVTSSDARTNNPMLSSDTTSSARIAMQFNSLVSVNPDNEAPFSVLASEVPTLTNGGISKDGLTYTFKLRKDVKWHDGQPFTARDVVFTYTAMGKKELGSPRTADINERIESVTASDDHTVVFKLKRVVAPFLTSSMYAIVPEHILKDVPLDQIKSHPFSTGDPKLSVGTGPFKFKEWVKDDHATLVKNPAYFRGEPALDEVIFKVVKDSNVVVSQLKTGEADVGAITAPFYEEMTRQAHLNIVKYDTYSFTYYGYQLDPARTTIFQEKEVRHALAYALDREAMVKAIYFGLAQVGQGTMPVLSWAYAPDQIKVKYNYDPQKAEELLDKAGWRRGSDGIRAKEGKRLSFNVWGSAGSTTVAQTMTVMQQQWKAIGVDATPKPEEWNAFLARITETKDFEMFLVGFSWGTDPDQTTMWATQAQTGGFNMNKYSNPRVDELLAQGLVELDQNRRKQLYLEMQNIIVEELPSFILFFPQAISGVNKRVHNLTPNAVNTRWNAHTWWVDDGK